MRKDIYHTAKETSEALRVWSVNDIFDGILKRTAKETGKILRLRQNPG